VTSGGADALKAAIRRSLLLIVALTVLGIVAVNVFKQLQGASYEATAKVLTSATPLSSIITGTEPSFVDPERAQQAELAIADSNQIYQRAARQTGQRYGDAAELEAATEVRGDPTTDLITFVATDPVADHAVKIANGVARAYIGFKQDVSTARIDRTIESLSSRVDDLPPNSSEQANLQEQIARLEVLRDAHREADLVEPAASAEQTSPAPVRDSAIGLSIGLVIALLCVAGRELIDTTIRSETEVEEILSAPVLASVRPLPRRTRMVSFGRHEPVFADTYALLAAQLLHELDGDNNVLAVTSSIAEEGKTTTTANLGVALARRGVRVVIADFDFRRPAMSGLFGISKPPQGALQVMSRTASLDEVLWSISLEGARPAASLSSAEAGDRSARRSTGDQDQTLGSLEVLPAGGTIPSRDFPHRSRLASVVDELRGRADVVVLDTPPALLTLEIAELSELIDSVLVVVRQGRATKRNLQSLARQARGWSTELVGAVLTDAPADHARGYYGGT
jgi:Mrp family chromosome partitioning ATPase